ncbi:hypothetical protein APSETT445_004916 [Aspergillus pseudonomiae]
MTMRSTDPILRGDRDKDDIRTHEQNTGSDEEYASEATINSQQVASLSTKKALWAYLILCFSTGPTSSMAFNYVSAAIQSAANTVGHQPGSDKPCARRGHIKCLVKFGAGEIDYVSYVHLNALATLYCLLTTVQGVYTVIEASYIPIFMRSVGGLHSASPAADPDTKRTWKKGFTVSVLALVASNVGGIVSLLIGIILVYGIGSYAQVGYFSYLLAITIAGCITIVFATIGQFMLPSVPGQERPKGQNLLLLAVKGWIRMIGSARQYPEAFKFCIGWILTVFASLIPCGSEAQFFGLEITLDLATGWINPLVQGVIQDHTHNLRFPMIPNVLLIFLAGLLYIWVDIPKGIEDAKVPLSEARAGN